MAQPRVAFGIDIGTSSCSVAYVTNDPRWELSPIVGVNLIGFGRDEFGMQRLAERVPSIVGTVPGSGKGRQTLFGFAFEESLRDRVKRPLPRLRSGRDFFVSVKSDLGTNRIYHQSRVCARRDRGSKPLVTPEAVTSEFMRWLCEAAREESGFDPREHWSVVTVPASLGSLARRELLAAAIEAGFSRDRLELLDEPVAALLDLLLDQKAAPFLTAEPRNVLVFDYGAGTCDLSLMRARFDSAADGGLRIENLAISPYLQWGGDNVDRAIMQEVIWRQVCPDASRAAQSATSAREIEDTLTFVLARQLKERMCRRLWRRDGQLTRDSLAAKPAEAVDAGLPGALKLDGLPQDLRRVVMRADEFERIMSALVSLPSRDGSVPDGSLLWPVHETLARAGLSVGDLDVLVMHGGSCQNPWVTCLLREVFEDRGNLFGGAQLAFTPNALTSVARGAARACYFRKIRDMELVKPILPEDLFVLVDGHRPERLMRRGTALPFPADGGVEDVTGTIDRFFVPEHHDARMLVPFARGSENEPVLAGIVTVPLPEDAQSSAPVRIKVRVDRNKTFEWWYSIAGADYQPAESIDDPWHAKAYTPEEKGVAEHRAALKQQLASGQAITLQDRQTEVRLVRQARSPSEALLLVEDYLDDDPENVEALNLKALILYDLGRIADAYAVLDGAVSKGAVPAHVIGNLGCIAAELGKFDEARARIRAALTVNPGWAVFYLELGDLERRAGNEKAAVREYKEGLRRVGMRIESFPFDKSAWSVKFRLLERLGRYREAIKAADMTAKLVQSDVFGGQEHAVIAGSQRDHK